VVLIWPITAAPHWNDWSPASGPHTLRRCPSPERVVSHVEQRIIVERQEGVWRILAPVPSATNALACSKSTSDEPDAACEALLGRAASTIAAAIVAARPYTDLFHRVRRRRELALAAELQWELLPVLECTAPDPAL